MTKPISAICLRNLPLTPDCLEFQEAASNDSEFDEFQISSQELQAADELERSHYDPKQEDISGEGSYDLLAEELSSQHLSSHRHHSAWQRAATVLPSQLQFRHVSHRASSLEANSTRVRTTSRAMSIEPPSPSQYYHAEQFNPISGLMTQGTFIPGATRVVYVADTPAVYSPPMSVQACGGSSQGRGRGRGSSSQAHRGLVSTLPPLPSASSKGKGRGDRRS